MAKNQLLPLAIQDLERIGVPTDAYIRAPSDVE
jgi:hypothetical protein